MNTNKLTRKIEVVGALLACLPQAGCAPAAEDIAAELSTPRSEPKT
jgi:hypothetical protein